jgi:hypothetical protein
MCLCALLTLPSKYCFWRAFVMSRRQGKKGMEDDDDADSADGDDDDDLRDENNDSYDTSMTQNKSSHHAPTSTITLQQSSPEMPVAANRTAPGPFLASPCMYLAVALHATAVTV